MNVARPTSKTLVVGIGSPHGDDQVGWRVIEEIRNAPLAEEITLRFANSPVHLLDWLDDCQQLYVCDGCRGLGAAGTLGSWRWPAKELTQVVWSGTHDLSLTAVLQLADQLGCLPRHVEVWAVELNHACSGETISPEVAAVVPHVAEAIRRELFTSNYSEVPGA